MSSICLDQRPVRLALARLGIDRLVLSIHQASFPPSSDDIGHGTPYSRRGREMIDWLSRLGFTGVALGPAGITGRTNPSPYDATAFSRNPLHIALAPLCEQGLLDEQLLERAVADRPVGVGVQYAYAWATQRSLLASAAIRVDRDAAFAARLSQFRQETAWLADEAGYEAVAAARGHEDWLGWPLLPPQSAEAANAFWLSQLLVRQQHAEFRSHCHRAGLRVYGDLPIGTSHRDRYLFRHLFLPGYAIGAPPSRTNPTGQPWGYPLLHPDSLEPGGDAHRHVTMRLDALLQDHDSLRIDHPHGWVCPWVYRTADPDPLLAVQQGARLHESPDLADHPALAPFARVRPDQLDRCKERHADNWVRYLEKEQVDRYAGLLDLIVERMRAHGCDVGDCMVEVLSTCPRPLAEVLARHRLGRYRVTQKANLENFGDVYRSDVAHPEDWIMVGNHDTPPLRAVIDSWQSTGELPRRADYLAARLTRDSRQRNILGKRLAHDHHALATAMFADLFCGPARNVLIFWADLFGLRDIYNRPGVVDGTNWSLRVPANFERAYGDAHDNGEQSLDLGLALAWALHARGLDQDPEGRALVADLERSVCST